MPKPDLDWRILAAKAMRTRAGFEKLLIAIEPWIKSTSVMYCRDDPQGAAQEARSNLFVIVFKRKQIDLTQSSACIANYLRSSVRRQICHESRRVARNGMNCMPRGQRGVPRDQKKEPMRHERPAVMPLSAGEHIHVPTTETQASNLPFPLPQYAEYFAVHGTLVGAAKYCETRYGFDAKKVADEFGRVVASMREAQPVLK